MASVLSFACVHCCCICWKYSGKYSFDFGIMFIPVWTISSNNRRTISYFIGCFLRCSSLLSFLRKHFLKIFSLLFCFVFCFVFAAAVCKFGCLLDEGKVRNVVRMHWSSSASSTPTDPCKGVCSRLGFFCELKPAVLLPTALVAFHHEIHHLLENKLCVYSQIGLSKEHLQ